MARARSKNTTGNYLCLFSADARHFHIKVKSINSFPDVQALCLAVNSIDSI